MILCFQQERERKREAAIVNSCTKTEDVTSRNRPTNFLLQLQLCMVSKVVYCDFEAFSIYKTSKCTICYSWACKAIVRSQVSLKIPYNKTHSDNVRQTTDSGNILTLEQISKKKCFAQWATKCFEKNQTSYLVSCYSSV